MEEFQDQDLAEAARQVRSEDSGFYRMEVRGTREQEKAADNQVLTEGQNLTTLYSSVGNSAYETFREEILHLARPARNGLMQESTENPVFLQLMGVKYLLVREGDETQVPEGYEKTGQVGSVDIYENQNVAPIGYVTDQAISTDTFEELPWPEKSLALEDRQEGQSSLEITFGEGSYEISDVEAWYGSAGESPSQEQYSDAGLGLTCGGNIGCHGSDALFVTLPGNLAHRNS